MKRIVLAVSLAAFLAGMPALAQETKKGMEMKHDMKQGKMHEKMQEEMKDKRGAGKKVEPAKKDDHKH